MIYNKVLVANLKGFMLFFTTKRGSLFETASFLFIGKAAVSIDENSKPTVGNKKYLI